MGALEILLSKSKSKDEPLEEGKGDAEGDAEGEDKEKDVGDEYLGDAFDALKSGDKAGFVSAMKSFQGC